jgi:activator of 2-hydroxyglutaryl-CoA dehydratase
LLKRVGLAPELTFIGGVAKQVGMDKVLEETAGLPVNVPDEPDFVRGARSGPAVAVKSRESTKC